MYKAPTEFGVKKYACVPHFFGKLDRFAGHHGSEDTKKPIIGPGVKNKKYKLIFFQLLEV